MTRIRKTWLGRFLIAMIMLAVFVMPVAPDTDDEDDIDGAPVMHQVVRDERYRMHKHVAETHPSIPPSTPAEASIATLLVASLDADVAVSFTPVPLAAHPLRP